MDNSLVVDVEISLSAATISRAAFGWALVVGPHTKFVPRTKWYEKATWSADMIIDGFLVTDPIYLAVETYFSQDPSPALVCVGRQQVDTQLVSIDTATGSDTYSILVSFVNGVDVNCTYTAAGSTTKAAIATGLAASVESSSIGSLITATGVDSNVSLIATATGTGFRVALNANAAKMSITAPTALNSIAVDLPAILLYDQGWYGIVFVDHSTIAQQALCAAFAESNGKLYIAPTADANVINQDLATDTTSIASLIKSLSRERSAAIYSSHAATEYLDAAWFGACLPQDPGSINWAFKNLSGVTGETTLTPTQRINVRAKRCNLYESLAGVDVTFEGWMGKAGYYLDIVHGLDAMTATIQENIIADLVRLKKIPMTDKGIAGVQANVHASIDGYIDTGFIGSLDSLTVPKRADISSANKAARTLPDVNFSATLAGAFNHVTVNGVVTE